MVFFWRQIRMGRAPTGRYPDRATRFKVLFPLYNDDFSQFVIEPDHVFDPQIIITLIPSIIQGLQIAMMPNCSTFAQNFAQTRHALVLLFLESYGNQEYSHHCSR